jgi:hypothetical protein
MLGICLEDDEPMMLAVFLMAGLDVIASCVQRFSLADLKE